MYYYKKLNCTDLPKLLHLVDNLFRENPCWAPVANWHHILIEKAPKVWMMPVLKQNISIAAVDENTGEYVGMLLLHFEDENVPTETSQVWSNFAKAVGENASIAFNIAGTLFRDLDIYKHYNTTRDIGFSFLSVDKNHARKGIAHGLVKEGLKVAAQVKAGVASTMTTSVFSEKIFLKEGFQVLREMKYQNFEYKGEFPYTEEMIGPHERCVVLCKPL